MAGGRYDDYDDSGREDWDSESWESHYASEEEAREEDGYYGEDRWHPSDTIGVEETRSRPKKFAKPHWKIEEFDSMAYLLLRTHPPRRWGEKSPEWIRRTAEGIAEKLRSSGHGEALVSPSNKRDADGVLYDYFIRLHRFGYEDARREIIKVLRASGLLAKTPQPPKPNRAAPNNTSDNANISKKSFSKIKVSPRAVPSKESEQASKPKANDEAELAPRTSTELETLKATCIKLRQEIQRRSFEENERLRAEVDETETARKKLARENEELRARLRATEYKHSVQSIRNERVARITGRIDAASQQVASLLPSGQDKASQTKLDEVTRELDELRKEYKDYVATFDPELQSAKTLGEDLGERLKQTEAELTKISSSYDASKHTIRKLEAKLSELDDADAPASQTSVSIADALLMLFPNWHFTPKAVRNLNIPDLSLHDVFLVMSNVESSKETGKTFRGAEPWRESTKRVKIGGDDQGRFYFKSLGEGLFKAHVSFKGSGEDGKAEQKRDQDYLQNQ